MDKKTINRLKEQNKNVNKPWSRMELAALIQLKANGIYPSIIINDEFTMKKYFSQRTKAAVTKKYETI